MRESIQVAKEKQATDKEKVKKLKKDMDEFNNNKEGKIEELKVGLLNTQDMTLLTPFAGQCAQAEGGVAEAEHVGQDEAQGPADS